KDASISGGQDVYKVDQEIEGSVKITGFSYKMEDPLVDVAGGIKVGSFRVSFFYQFINKAVNNPNIYEKKIDQKYEVITDASGVFTSCYSNTDNSVSEILARACKSVGASTSSLPAF